MLQQFLDFMVDHYERKLYRDNEKLLRDRERFQKYSEMALDTTYALEDVTRQMNEELYRRNFRYR